MSAVLESLREQAGIAGPAAELANELLTLADQYEKGELNREEFNYLVQEIADVRAQQELAHDEIACRYIVDAATILLSVV
jgi:polyhydroxyalkanoate synthesis regulator phasin